MGATISITIPESLEERLRKEADSKGMSRSGFIRTILIKWGKDREPEMDLHQSETPPNNCKNREDDGFCCVFEHVCNAPQGEADTCASNPERKDINNG